jgi:DUF4097 and DUF4098 domain-containing protein YvlB
MRRYDVVQLEGSSLMKNILSLAFGIFLAGSVIAEEINETIDAAADGQVDVVNIAGSVEVLGWSNSSVEVTGTLGDKVDELILERNGDRVLVKVKVPRNSHGKIASELVIRIPKMSSLDVSAVSADIDVEGVAGEQSLQTVSGDIETEAGEHDIAVESVSGDIEIDGNSDDAETSAGTVSGDITLSDLAGTVEAGTVSGDVIIDSGSFNRAGAESVNGDISFEAVLRKGGKLEVETINGDVDIDFSNDVSAQFDIETFNGDINNCFGPEAERTSRYAPGLELSFEVDGGNGRVAVSTLNGDINICK